MFTEFERPEVRFTAISCSKGPAVSLMSHLCVPNHSTKEPARSPIDPHVASNCPCQPIPDLLDSEVAAARIHRSALLFSINAIRVDSKLRPDRQSIYCIEHGQHEADKGTFINALLKTHHVLGTKRHPLGGAQRRVWTSPPPTHF